MSEEKKECCCGCGCEETKESKCCCENDPNCCKELIADCGIKEKGICCIKALGKGCVPCDTSFAHLKEAVSKLGIGVEVVQVSDEEATEKYGVPNPPGIAVNGHVVYYGKALEVDEIVALIRKLG